MKFAQKGFAHVGLVVLVVVLLIIGAGGWFVYSKNTVADPEQNIVPEQQKPEEPKEEATMPEESATGPYRIEELGIYIDLEPNWTVNKKVNPQYDDTRYTITGRNGADAPLEFVSIVAFKNTIPAGFSGCSDNSEMDYIKVTELSATGIDGVVVFGTEGDRGGLALVDGSMQYASTTKSLTAPRLKVSELQVGSTYYLCGPATPPASWSVDFDNDLSNQDGVYAAPIEGDGTPNAEMSGYQAVVKMLRSVRR